MCPTTNVYLDEGYAVCPRFRILVVGNTSVGKSSLVNSVFNNELNDEREGVTNIELEYTSQNNPRFIFHDSRGFSSGCTANLGFVEQFLRNRSSCIELKDRIHAIWLCIETPRTGSRLEQTGNEKILLLAKELNIPILTVFTKFDVLVNEHLQNNMNNNIMNSNPREEAVKDFEMRIGDLKASTEIDYVWISTKPEYSSSLKYLLEVARNRLHNVEGELWLSWATVQQMSAYQKVDRSIREGCKKKYWLNLSRSFVLHGQALTECLSRIHQDIVKVWTFYDPDNLLSDYLFANVIELTQTFTPVPDAEARTARDNDWLAHYSDAMALVNAIGTSVAQAVGGLGIAIVALKYFYRTCRSIEPSARYIGAYIIDVTLILYKMFITMLPKDPPRTVTKELIKDTLEHYRTSDCAKVHCNVRVLTLRHFEDQMIKLAKETL